MSELPDCIAGGEADPGCCCGGTGGAVVADSVGDIVGVIVGMYGAVVNGGGIV